MNKRNSITDIGKIYFWTATINKWQRLLVNDTYKDIIIGSLKYLSDLDKIDVFAFVIMPNHIHLIWRKNDINGKESVNGSFLKFTAHQFKKQLLKEGNNELLKYRVKANNKSYEFWQRDPLAIDIYSPEVASQKLDYIHNNPLAEQWDLVQHPVDYKYSSAGFYEEGSKEFQFIKDLRDEF
ncbi:transposase [Mangrovivirga sp. M17]|uniref:Transposase n=1 Tax=Mangrovivirga halotolerans TaxID=2993936 RepID=A0ABT3RTD0_9BACT|nr:transposase [Mangrovivirga halotolerans]MCX2744400.1 transposase [Mangrovivirga halotolerans]